MGISWLPSNKDLASGGLGSVGKVAICLVNGMTEFSGVEEGVIFKQA
jgi:hypothetical protein